MGFLLPTRITQPGLPKLSAVLTTYQAQQRSNGFRKRHSAWEEKGGVQDVLPGSCWGERRENACDSVNRLWGQLV